MTFCPPAGRLGLVERTRAARADFLRLAARLGCLKEPDAGIKRLLGLGEDDDGDDERANEVGPAEIRKRAMARHEARKAADALFEDARAAFDRASSAPAEERDELERDVVVAELGAAAAAAANDLASDDKELEMLRMMARRAGGAPARAPPPRKPRAGDEGWLLDQPSDGKGLRVLKIAPNERGEIATTRERVRAGVFQPGHRLPTMSLEEFADLEVADAMQRSAAQKAAAEHKPSIAEDTRRRDELERDGDDDDTARFDAARDRTEAWADWLEEHPRGSGNKGKSQL